jgi:hypothetical protein
MRRECCVVLGGIAMLLLPLPRLFRTGVHIRNLTRARHAIV